MNKRSMDSRGMVLEIDGRVGEDRCIDGWRGWCVNA